MGFNEELYHRRNLVETAFSVIKRKYGEEIKSRKYWNQLKEIKIKLIVHNWAGMPRLSVQFK